MMILMRVAAELVPAETHTTTTAYSIDDDVIALIEQRAVDTVSRAIQTLLQLAAARLEEATRVGQLDHNAACLLGVVYELKNY
jgi:hypothetical protein